MKKSSLFSLWGILFIICAGLGFIPEPEGAVRVILLLISLLFFVPPGVLLWDARQTGNQRTLRTLRNLSLTSLITTSVLLAANILSVFRAEWVGNLCHALLVICSAPMFCSNFWALSLFLWAVLLFAAIQK